MAVGGAIITRDSSGVRELLTDRENALLCRPGDSRSLAECIRELKNNAELRSLIKKNARELFERQCTPSVLGKELASYLTNLARD